MALLGPDGKPLSTLKSGSVTLIEGGNDKYNTQIVSTRQTDVDSVGCDWGTNIEGMWLNDPGNCVVQWQTRRRSGTAFSHFELWAALHINGRHVATSHMNIDSREYTTRWRCRYVSSLAGGSYNGQVLEVESWITAWCRKSNGDYFTCDEEKYDNYGPYRLGHV